MIYLAYQYKLNGIILISCIISITIFIISFKQTIYKVTTSCLTESELKILHTNNEFEEKTRRARRRFLHTFRHLNGTGINYKVIIRQIYKWNSICLIHRMLVSIRLGTLKPSNGHRLWAAKYIFIWETHTHYNIVDL